MFLMESVVSRLLREQHSVMDNKEPLKLELLTMTVSTRQNVLHFRDTHSQHHPFPLCVFFAYTVMAIGFTQIIRRVCECDAPEGEDFLAINIPVATLRTAEREHPMLFRLQSAGTAIVEPRIDVRNQQFDAHFGTRVQHGAPIQEEFDLEHLVATIPPPQAEIRNDLQPEDEECFTICIFPVDVLGRRQLFVCNNDDTGVTNYLCETTICIEDDDSKYLYECELLMNHFLNNNYVRSI